MSSQGSISSEESTVGRGPARTARYCEIVILQATPYCNLRCRYCYLSTLDLKQRMSMETVERIFTSLRDADLVGPALTVNWHAGEPLAVPKAFYRGAFARIAAVVGAGTVVRHVIQTNATLIDDEWCELFVAHGVAVGVSLDGPREVHDGNRIDRRGHGSFDKTLAGLRRLRYHDVEYGVLMVVNPATLAHARDVWQFFIDERIGDVAHNVEEVEGAHLGSGMFNDAAQAGYAGFLRDYLRRRRAGEGLPRFRELDRVLNRLRGGADDRQRREPENVPLALLTFAWDGSYASFSPGLASAAAGSYGGFMLGNVHSDELGEVRRRATFLRLAGDIEAGVERCRAECDYFAFCGGGCPVNKWCETGSFRVTETQHCRMTVKTLVDVVTGVA